MLNQYFKSRLVVLPWKRQTLLLAWLFFYFIGLCSMARGGERLTIAGNKAISTIVIRRWLAVSSELSPVAQAGEVRQNYRLRGYYDATADLLPVSGQPENIMLEISEGRQVLLGRISLEYPPDFSGQLDLLSPTDRLTGPASQENIERGIGELLAFFVEAGYPAATISPTDYFRVDDKLDLTLIIDPGRRARVGWWIISGLTRTNSAMVRRALGLRIGISWNSAAQKQIKRRLAELDYLVAAGPMRIAELRDDSLLVVEIPLVERPAMTAEGGIGMGSGAGVRGGSANVGLQGRLTMIAENPFGRGRRLEFLISRPTNSISRSRLRLVDRHLFGTHLGAVLELEQQRSAQRYDRFSGALGAESRWSSGLRSDILFRWTKITPLGVDEENAIVPARRYDLSLAVGHEFSSAAPDRAIENTSWRLETTASFRRDFTPGPTGGNLISRLRSVLRMSHLWRPTTQFAVSLGSVIDNWWGPDHQLHWGDEIYLGGASSVRGHPEAVYLSRGYGLLSAELILGAPGQLNIFTFGDLAYRRRFALDTGEKLWRRIAGYGLGLAARSYLGRHRLEVGWPDGGALRDGVIYLRWLRGW